MIEKYGFVYIWFDRKRKMYYVGSHWGHINDGYICSSNRMRDAYRRRPNDFKRRIIKSNISRTELLTEEHKWLSFINEDEFGEKYYNLHNRHLGHWSTNNIDRSTVGEKVRKAQKRRVEAGIHPWLGENNVSVIQIKNGTHPWLQPEHKKRTRQLQYEKVKNGSHPFVGGKVAKKANSDRLRNGTHNFLNKEWHQQMREKRSDTWEVVFPNGDIFVVKNLKQFCIQNGLNQGAMNQVGIGKKAHHKGYSCRKIMKGKIQGKKMNHEESK